MNLYPQTVPQRVSVVLGAVALSIATLAVSIVAPAELGSGTQERSTAVAAASPQCSASPQPESVKPVGAFETGFVQATRGSAASAS